MATASENAELVLRSIFPDRVDLYEVANRQLSPEHFSDPALASIWRLQENYYDKTGGIMPKYVLSRWAEDQGDVGRVALFEELYDTFSAGHVPDAEFTWAVSELRRIVADDSTKLALTLGMEVLTKGRADDQTGEVVKGHEEARTAVLEAFGQIDKDLGLEDAPEGDMRTEVREFLTDYAEAKRATQSGQAPGIQFSLNELDAKIGGIKNGDLVLSAGYSNEGKTSLCVQLAWSAAIEQGKNVVFFTTETTRDVVRRKIVSRHSTHHIFTDAEAAHAIPSGINSSDLKNGTLNDHEQEALKDVLRDLAGNKNYGKLHLAQVPRGASMATIESRMARLQREFNVELVIVDSIYLLRSSRHRMSDREELSGIVKEAKQIATTFDSGRGVPIVSPWQVNRTWKEKADTVGYYTSAALAETAEATNSADIITSLLAPSDNTERFTELKMQVLKNRDGETANGLLVQVDYATSTFITKPSFGASDFTFAGSEGGIESLINY